VLAGEKARLGRTIAGVWLHDRLAQGLEYVAGEEVCELSKRWHVGIACGSKE
jgi:hypothetical protein